MTTVLAWALYFALGCYVLALACSTWHLLRSSSTPDRIIAMDAMYICGMLVLLGLGLRFSQTAYFDIALLIGMLGFVGSTAMAKFLLRGEVIEP